MFLALDIAYITLFFSYYYFWRCWMLGAHVSYDVAFVKTTYLLPSTYLPRKKKEKKRAMSRVAVFKKMVLVVWEKLLYEKSASIINLRKCFIFTMLYSHVEQQQQPPVVGCF